MKQTGKETEGSCNTQKMLVVLAILTGVCFWVNTESFWLDEGFTGTYAIQPDFSSWLHHLRQDNNADCQMPLHPFLVWVTGRLFGLQEWVLRGVSVGAILFSALLFWRMGHRLKIPCLVFIFLIQPYVWFYAMEARPYAVMILAGTLLLTGWIEFILNRGNGSKWAIWLGGGILMLSLCTILAPLVYLIIGLTILAWILFYGCVVRGRAMQLICWALLGCLPIGIYYLNTLLKGVKGAVLWKVSPLNLVYWIYEVTGAMGLGPSKEALREAAANGDLKGLVAGHLPEFLLCGILVALGLGLGVLMWRIRQKRGVNSELLRSCFIIFVLYGAVLFLGGWLTQKPFWGRHLAPVFPFYVMGMAAALSLLQENFPGKCSRWMLWVACLLMLGSSFNYRFNPKFANEDNRGAALATQDARKEGRTIWWCASRQCAVFYGVVGFDENPQNLHFVEWLGEEEIRSLGRPDLVVLEASKLYDPKGTLVAFVHSSGMKLKLRLQEIDVYEREEANSFEKVKP